jgi:hypothetical protein
MTFSNLHGDGLKELLAALSFRNNPNLRPAGAEIAYTQDMIDEWLKCKNDPLHFMRNYVHIIHLDKGVVKMEPYPFQERVINAYHANRRTIVLTPRQYGKTITAAIYLLWYVIFNSNKTVAILANKQSTADEILHRVRMAYELLPKWLQAGVKSWNKRSIELENNSRLFCAATSSTGVRGKSINLLMLDELAFVDNNLAEEFFTSVYPTISSSLESKIIITSTPHGYNMFHKFWVEAENGTNGFCPIKVEWTEMPGRTQEWYDEQKGVLGELKAAQELDCTFLGSSLTLLTGGTLAKMAFKIPQKEFGEGQYRGLKIYELPQKNSKYTMTVDVSRGRHLDASAFMVFDVSDYPHRIVASYNNSEISPLQYAALIYHFAKQYNEAYVLIEINDVGAQVADEMYFTYEYENLYWTKSGDTLGKKGTDPYPGIRTTKKTKRIGCANLKDIIEKDQLIVDDHKSIQELSTFVQSKSGSYEADDGFHDDAVMCLVLFAWLVTQPWFVDLYDKSIRNQMYNNAVSQMEEDLLPFFVQDGSDQYEDETPESLGMRSLLH